MVRVVCSLSLIAALCLVTARPAPADSPRPVDLNIPNIAQETDVWCWAAVAQQVIVHAKGSSPPQCALVADAYGVERGACCPNTGRCTAAGDILQIQFLIASLGDRLTSIAPVEDPMALYRMLRAGRPAILLLGGTSISNHVVVLRGMSWRMDDGAPQAILHINDPFHHFPPRIAFSRLKPYWQAVIVVL